jgi:hypothetical protein
MFHISPYDLDSYNVDIIMTDKYGNNRPDIQDKSNPKYYAKLNPQPIEVIEAWWLGYHLGNAMKYIARAGSKAGESKNDDLKKAIWYLQREMKK